MKVPSINSFYNRFYKHVLLAQSYTEIKNLFFIFKSCRLKPYDYFFERKTSNLILYRKWFDEFGNSLEINTNKRINITYNNLSLNKEKIICTDLYYGLSIDKIAKISKLIYIFSGKDEDTYQDVIMVTFLGIDNYFRTFTIENDEWIQVSSLLLGMNNLKFIGADRDLH